MVSFSSSLCKFWWKIVFYLKSLFIMTVHMYLLEAFLWCIKIQSVQFFEISLIFWKTFITPLFASINMNYLQIEVKSILATISDNSGPSLQVQRFPRVPRVSGNPSIFKRAHTVGKITCTVDHTMGKITCTETSPEGVLKEVKIPTLKNFTTF